MLASWAVGTRTTHRVDNGAELPRRGNHAILAARTARFQYEFAPEVGDLLTAVFTDDDETHLNNNHTVSISPPRTTRIRMILSGITRWMTGPRYPPINAPIPSREQKRILPHVFTLRRLSLCRSL